MCGNILFIELLAQVNCTEVFSFNPHPINIFPKDSILMPALHTQGKGSSFFSNDHYSLLHFEMYVCDVFFHIVMMSLNNRLQAIFGAAFDDFVAQSHETQHIEGTD